jgi:hypothetical protein
MPNPSELQRLQEEMQELSTPDAFLCMPAEDRRAALEELKQREAVLEDMLREASALPR